MSACCTKCHNPFSESRPQASQGRQCRPCVAAYARAYWEQNQERLSTERKAWAEANPERKAAADKRWAQENPERRRAAQRKWSATNVDFERSLKRQYRADNKGRVTAWQAKRRAAQLQRTPAWLTTDDMWMMEQAYELAQLRTQMFGFEWHVDHVLPLQGKTVSGLHVPHNLRVIPGVVNVQKGNRV